MVVNNALLQVYLLSGTGEEYPMLGPVYRIRLPVSKASEYFEDKPEFHFYPFFNAIEGSDKLQTCITFT